MANEGLLTLITLSEKERLLFLDYMAKSRQTEAFDMLDNFFEEDFIKFLDLFAGISIRIPQRKDVYEIAKNIRIYSYVKAHGETEQSITDAAQLFDKRKAAIKKVMIRMNKIIEQGAVDEGGLEEDERPE